MKRRTFTVVGILTGIIVGTAAGLGGYTFWYADGASYLTNDPAACANCHVMDDQYSGWMKSSHHNVAVCNDCHAPHNFFGKYYVKGVNGWNHSLKFTLNNFHEPIQITEMNREVTENACRYCHQDIVDMIDAPEIEEHGGDWQALSCIRCHEDVGHMTR